MPNQSMKHFIMADEMPDYYIEKPIPFKELVYFLRLLNILWQPEHQAQTSFK